MNTISALPPLLLVAIGGGTGAMLRYLVGRWALAAFGPGFPVGTLAVNLLGGLAMGLVVGMLARVGGNAFTVLLVGSSVVLLEVGVGRLVVSLVALTAWVVPSVPGSPSGLTEGMRTRAWVSSTTFAGNGAMGEKGTGREGAQEWDKIVLRCVGFGKNRGREALL